MLQITSPAARSLFRAIVEDPADDVPRLLLADVLEEAGDGERAELIRIGCERARLEALERIPAGLPVADWRQRQAQLIALRHRERELLDREAIRWVAALGVARLRPAALAPSGHSLMGATFRRGFVWKVDCTVEQWCGVVCPVCSGWRSREAYCEHCQGTGRTGGYGPALVLAAPIERVVYAHKYPMQHQDFSGRIWHWQRSVGGSPADVPPVLYDLLPGNLFGEPAEGLGALSRAALAWARQEAGLPALTF